jgi:chemotaxis protein MotB
MSKGRKRHEEHEEHVNHERWLVSYADMMTLLMVLFIVMFAISQVDIHRFDQLKEGMAAGFGADPSPFEGGKSTMDGEGPTPIKPLAPQTGTSSTAAAADATHRGTVSRRERRKASDEVERLERIRRQVARVLRRKGLLGDVEMAIDERGLTISLVSRHIVFRANEATLSARGKRVLAAIGPVVRAVPNQIDVDGHTNQVKVKPKYYPTDWELSSARAITVLRYLDERAGLPSRRLSAVAFGHERPLLDPSLPAAAALNKRVDLVLRSASPEKTRALFASVLRDRQNLRTRS